MAGLKFTTDLDADALYKIAFRRAQELGYTVRAAGDRAFTAASGNVALSVLAVSSYCDFRGSVENYPEGNDFVLERNTPWLLGVIGVARVKSKARELLQNIKVEVAQRGGHITDEKEFWTSLGVVRCPFSGKPKATANRAPR